MFFGCNTKNYGVKAMELHVNVELKDGSVCMMAKKAFNVFLALDTVARFKRADGWAVVGLAKLRDLDTKNDYPSAADRRAVS
jgi:hypothetical protein